MIRIFIGYDKRQKVAYNTLAQSIIDRASVPVSITPLVLETLPITRRGLTEFTFSRFLVPWLCDYKGHAIFMDADMLCLGDVAELWKDSLETFRALGDDCPVLCRKFTGREQFERASLMVFQNKECRTLTPDYVEDTRNNPLDMRWAETIIGDIPPWFNRLVGYEDCSDAKILHYTAGIPTYPETHQFGHVEEWMQEAASMNSFVPFEELMGQSVHIQNLNMKEVASG